MMMVHFPITPIPTVIGEWIILPVKSANVIGEFRDQMQNMLATGMISFGGVG